VILYVSGCINIRRRWLDEYSGDSRSSCSSHYIGKLYKHLIRPEILEMICLVPANSKILKDSKELRLGESITYYNLKGGKRDE